MEKIRIVGGKALEGTVRISGAKNASLPDVCASILTDQAVILSNVPEVRDIRTMGRVLSAMGVATDIKVGGVVELKAAKMTRNGAMNRYGTADRRCLRWTFTACRSGSSGSPRRTA